MMTTKAEADRSDIQKQARLALERVCSGARLDDAPDYYSAKLVDHVNDMEFHGLLGTRQSVALYKAVLSELEIE